MTAKKKPEKTEEKSAVQPVDQVENVQADKATKTDVPEDVKEDSATKTDVPEDMKEDSATKTDVPEANKEAKEEKEQLKKTAPGWVEPYIKAYPDNKVFYRTNDGQVFLDNARHLAENHQRSLKKGKLETLNI